MKKLIYLLIGFVIIVGFSLNNNLRGDVNSAQANPLLLLFTPAPTDTTHYVDANKILGGSDLTLNALDKLYFDGGGNTYIYEAAADVIYINAGGKIVSLESAGLKYASAQSWLLRAGAVSVTNPSICPSSSDSNTGIAWVSADTLSMVAGGVSVAHIGPDGYMLGTPTGGFKGIGTLNAKAVYDDNTILTGDYVFEPTFEYNSIVEMESFYKEYKHLPTLTSQSQLIEMGNISLGQRLNEVIVTIEIQAKYIVELEKRLVELDNK